MSPRGKSTPSCEPPFRTQCCVTYIASLGPHSHPTREMVFSFSTGGVRCWGVSLLIGVSWEMAEAGFEPRQPNSKLSHQLFLIWEVRHSPRKPRFVFSFKMLAIDRGTFSVSHWQRSSWLVLACLRHPSIREHALPPHSATTWKLRNIIRVHPSGARARGSPLG